MCYRPVAIVSLILAACLCAASPGHAEVLKFDGGNGTTQVDQYQGIAGGDWLEGWVPSGVTASVVNTDPIGSSGNYLSIGGIEGGNGVTRQFTAPTTHSYNLVLDLRVDSVPGSGTINLSAGQGRLINTNSSNFVQANATPSGGWRFAGDGVGHSSGIALVAGTTYHFDFLVDPVAKSYTAALSDGATIYTSPVIPFRNQGTAISNPFFELGAQSGSGTYVYSLDNVGFVPEPSTWALLAGGLLMLAFYRRRRKK